MDTIASALVERYDAVENEPGLANGDFRSTPKTSRSNGWYRGIMEFCY